MSGTEPDSGWWRELPPTPIRYELPAIHHLCEAVLQKLNDRAFRVNVM